MPPRVDVALARFSSLRNQRFHGPGLARSCVDSNAAEVSAITNDRSTPANRRVAKRPEWSASFSPAWTPQDDADLRAAGAVGHRPCQSLDQR